MPLEDVLEKLYTRRRFGIKPGVDRVRTLLARLGNPEKSFRSIHVVGTNGKGSTSAFLASILREAGYRVGQFSSPHLVRYGERFRVDGSAYPDEKLSGKLERVLDVAPEDATFFEITTALAALVFCDEKVDLAVIEAGMGGRSDATAAIPAEMTLITTIAMDHSDYLGKTLPDIAAEKAGIAEPGTAVVSAVQADEVLSTIQNHCLQGGNRLRIFGRDFSSCWRGPGLLDYSGLSAVISALAPGIPGRYQTQNAALAMAAAELLDASGTAVSAEVIRQGIAGADWPGRMELIPGTPPLLLDGAHNPAGALALSEALADYRYSRILLVTGVCADKDIDLIYAPLTGLADRIYTVTPAVERAVKAEELSSYFSGLGFCSRPSGTVIDGIRTAQEESRPGDLILVCGSLFVVGEVKAWLENVPYNGIRG